MTLALPPVYDLAPNADGVYVMLIGENYAYDATANYCRRADTPANPETVLTTTRGFGLTMAMLDRSPPAKHPWLTVDLAAQEVAISARQADPEAVWQDSLA